MPVTDHIRWKQTITGESSLSAQELADLMRPCVYLFMRGDEVLYVGSSARGVFRVSPSHHQQRAKAEADRIDFIWFDTLENARKSERELIVALKPTYNGRGKMRSYWNLERLAQRPVHRGGCLFKRKDSPYWYAAVYVNGKQRQQSTKTTDYEKAQELLERWMAERDALK